MQPIRISCRINKSKGPSRFELLRAEQKAFDSQRSRAMARSTVWITTASFVGWGCSDCGWTSAVPTLLSTPDAKSAFDRLAVAKFRAHKCEEHSTRLEYGTTLSVTERIRKMAAKGYKPKDAVEIVLQEIQLEFRSQPSILEAARVEAQDFLRRMREGIL